ELPEGARREYTAGLGAHLSKHFAVDAAYLYLDQEDRNGRVLLSGPDTGTYSFHANLFGVSVIVRFSHQVNRSDPAKHEIDSSTSRRRDARGDVRSRSWPSRPSSFVPNGTSRRR